VAARDDPHVLRATFDDAAELYDQARPVMPPYVLDDLVRLARLEPGMTLLEIGCGTGQATLPLAERGLDVVAIELGEALAEVARRRLADYPGVSIVTSSFEDWDPAGAQFDAVVAFNSFHWLDPDVRLAKSAAVLREGGSLGVLGTAFVEHDDADPVWLSLKTLEEEATGEERRHVNALRDRSADFLDGGHFRGVTINRYRWDVAYDTDAYIDLLGTISRFRVLDKEARAALFEQIRARVDEQGGMVAPTVAAVLYVAERA
jgi:SAM-dependent methyltransferase